MLGFKPIDSSMDHYVPFDDVSTSVFENVKRYISLIGKLIYLTLLDQISYLQLMYEVSTCKAHSNVTVIHVAKF